MSRAPLDIPARRRSLAAALGALVAFSAAGCDPDIERAYGRRSGVVGGSSVNGTAVLAELFEQAGHNVRTGRALTPGLMEQADLIVWAPDDFAAPTKEVVDWFDEWFDHEPDRVLVYVGRDFDAGPLYWQAVLPQATGAQAGEMKARLVRDTASANALRSALQQQSECDWFEIDGTTAPRDVQRLEGRADWVAGIDVGRAQLRQGATFRVPAGSRVLLEADGDPFVFRQPRGDGQLLTVSNGSFLLNLPLVNHEHRKLAGRLVREATRPRRGETLEVVFLESGAGGPPIRDTDEPDQRTGLEILVTAPFDLLFLHLAALGTILAFARWPIFGVPRRPPPPSRSDFGDHVAALGKLLERTGDAARAADRVAHYHQRVRRDVGGFQAAGPSAATRPPSSAALPPDAPPAGPTEPNP